MRRNPLFPRTALDAITSLTGCHMESDLTCTAFSGGLPLRLPIFNTLNSY